VLRLLAALFLGLLATQVHATSLLPETAPAEEVATPVPTAGSIELDQGAGQDERIQARISDIFTNVPSL
jgi:hypothetical protein